MEKYKLNHSMTISVTVYGTSTSDALLPFIIIFLSW
jgi:hypothetical protein